MSNSIPAGPLADFFAPQMGKEPVALLTLQHPDFPDVARISSGGVRVSDSPLVYEFESNGETYTFTPFANRLPDDIDQRGPVAQLVVENVSRDLVAFARSVTTRGTCQIQLVDGTDGDLVIRDFPDLDIMQCSYNAGSITFELSLDALNEVAYPADLMTPANCPAMFA